jgi:hypothetical protein
MPFKLPYFAFIIFVHLKNLWISQKEILMNTSFWDRIKAQSRATPLITNTLIPYPPHSPSLTASSKNLQCRLITPEDISTIILFLRSHFRYRHHKSNPDLIIDPAFLLHDISNGAYGVLCYDITSENIIGCIWARPIGKIHRSTFEVDTYLVEHLCVNETYRGKGITRLMLNWIEVNRPTPETRFIFLKEGRQVPTAVITSDRYIFKRFAGKMIKSIKTIPNVSRISLEECYSMLKDNDRLLINMCSSLQKLRTHPLRTQLWCYRDDSVKAVMAITETHQCHPLDGQKIALITGWWCSDNDTKQGQSQIQSQVQLSIFAAQPYSWIWSPAAYICNSNSSEWNSDGIISWQPYLWSAPTDMKDVFLIL